MRKLLHIVFAAVLCTLCAAPAFAQKERYPDKPIRLIIPFAPGGGIDTIGRIMAQKLTDGFGQSVVVDNRAGAGGKIGIETALTSAPVMSPVTPVLPPKKSLTTGSTRMSVRSSESTSGPMMRAPSSPVSTATGADRRGVRLMLTASADLLRCA